MFRRSPRLLFRRALALRRCCAAALLFCGFADLFLNPA